MHVFDENEDLIQQEYDELESSDIKKLCHVNRNLAGELFEYVCDILEKNKDIKLDREILTKLLNRNPKLFSLSVEQNYFYRNFDFERLVAILNKNETLKKSNISIDDIYQILVDTCQIDNEEIFGYLISSEDFQKNHQKIDEFLNECNGKAFADITNIIIKYFDKDYDRISIVKKRKEFSRNSNHFFT